MAPVPLNSSADSSRHTAGSHAAGMGADGAARAYDLIVAGAGGVGSAAAYHAAHSGRRVLLLEQFAVGHTRGSSHGGSRIIRYTHDSPGLAGQMPATFQLWHELERESGARLLQLTGGLYMARQEDAWLAGCQATLEELGFSHQVMDAAGLRRAYPQFNLPDGWRALYQANTGILSATRCVETMVAQAQQHGAEVRTETPVLAVQPDGEGVTVQLASGERVRGSRAILAAGPWSGRFLAELLDFGVPLRVTQQQVAYYAVQDPAAYAVGTFPIFITALEDHLYGFPIWERAGSIKVALEQTARTVDPDGPRAVDDELLARLSALVATYLPGVDPAPVHVEPCLYTETPTRDFVIDRHPHHPQIVIAAGFSGRGFKHTIAVGKLLVDLAFSGPGVYGGPFWQDSYRITRFAQTQTPTA
ncbi:MAG: N-methyl-L-tryptophan oxidase [Chloroflexi bacterium]|nr:MAG: N-methyl-L-tryptophan oxidase [Chloroflexota bacterium]